LFDNLEHHLFPGDGDEHGAVILAGIGESSRGTRFLAREVVLAKDGEEYVPGKYGYRALSANFVARVSDRCARENLCYFAVHCHGGQDSVGFSEIDLESQRRGYPALLDITEGGPVGALVFARNAVAGTVWRRNGVTSLDALDVVGPNLLHLYPHPSRSSFVADPAFSRQSLLFGARGQQALGEAKIGIIGLGGVGSLVSQWLAHLGVGHIVGVDYDCLEPSNRSRVVGASPKDTGEPYVYSRIRIIRSIGRVLARKKVKVAERVARGASPRIRYDAIDGNVIDASVAALLTDVDYLFLCADSMQSRLVFNALGHQYLIPGVQIGSKVPVEKKSGAVGDVYLASRRVLPYAGGGCLSCNQLIPADRLRNEMLTPEERQGQGYVQDPSVIAPSVITLNSLAAAQAVNDFLFGFHGLLEERAHAQDGYLMHYPRERLWQTVECASADSCVHCGLNHASVYGRGNRVELPCKQR
jgi:molybdopterin/thiamine biosynthesis adenylyltransferase